MRQADSRHPRSSHLIYLWLVGSAFIAFTIVFLFFPRSKFSELEKRDLAEFPDASDYKGNLSGYTADISQWFSDSEPFRDHFMTLSMTLRDKMGVRPGDSDEAISFKASDNGAAISDEEVNPEAPEGPAGNPLADENAKASNSGTIVVGKGDNVRALMAFGASEKAAGKFADMANRYAEAFPDLHIYALVAPLATEFYLPEKGKSLSKPQKPVLDHLQRELSPRVKFVDVYTPLAAHTDEDIYLRTDHHWAPLGAYYAAQAFARTAGVPFKSLDNYEPHTLKNFVGSMYGYTKDIAVKNAPEDFKYYTPKGLNYKSTFTTFNIDRNFQITSATKPYEAEFFRKFKDGSGNAYLTFMGSDQNLVKVVTGSGQPRKLLIIKDSYGNAIPGYLFYSFGEVHVVDFRYFPRNVKDYIKENGITDILFAFNIFNACSSSATSKVTNFLTRPNGIVYHPAEDHKPAVTPTDRSGEVEPEEQPSASPAPEIKETAPVREQEAVPDSI